MAKIKCEFCNGTGVDPSSYGYTIRGKKYLKDMLPKECPQCKGKKYKVIKVKKKKEV